ncbi:uncharacterized protein LOC121377614 [Gigantopelta aegis]|uniref:uncharacterized protein LOC121377614 n=1 Tax=Gigantopelta aegis TaxID=1735272 RepID=UPI001B88AD1B|nr:uncharacterized protein LOC121377614 [Gigantopelta aegis]
MKYTLVLILLVAITFNHQTEGLGRRRRRNTNNKDAGMLDKRDLSEFDTNKDGHVDEAELENLFNTREARDILERAGGKDGNNTMTLQEFQKFIKYIYKLE